MCPLPTIPESGTTLVSAPDYDTATATDWGDAVLKPGTLGRESGALTTELPHLPSELPNLSN